MRSKFKKMLIKIQSTLLLFGAANLFWVVSFFSHSLLGHGLLDERLRDVSAEIKQSPKDVNLYIKRGKLHQEHSAWADAMSDYKKVLGLDPANKEVYFWRAKLYRAKGELPKAEKDLAEYLRYRPLSAMGHAEMAELMQLMHRPADAAAHYDQAIKNNTRPAPELFLQRIKALTELKPEPVKRIQQGIEEGIQIFGPIVTLIEPLIELNIREKNYSSALSNFQRLPAVLQQSPLWMLKKAELFSSMGSSGDAMDSYKTLLSAIEAMPEHKNRNPAIAAIHEKASAALTALQNSPPMP
jgi:tetratricopeptide (TPR) repeat protein